MKRDQRASILIMVIWVLMFFAILGSAIYKMFYAQIDLTARLQERIYAQFSAHSAVVLAQNILKQDKTAEDTLYELNTQVEKELEDSGIRFHFIDEQAKLDINVASVQDLLVFPGITKDVADNIVQYSFKPFLVKEELLLVDEVNMEIYESLRGHVTVFGHNAININTASKEVLISMGFSQYLAEKIIDFRSGMDGIEGNEDDRFFENSANVISVLDGYFGISLSDRKIIEKIIIAGKIAIDSEVVTMDLQTSLRSKKTVKFLITLSEDRILQWREN